MSESWPLAWPPILALLALILLANGLPALLGLLLGPARPVDGGAVLADGRRALGQSKTWRGVAVALAGTALASLALGLGWALGLKVAVGAILGDLLTSFLKRRLGRPPHASLPPLDQVPEALIPALLAKDDLGLGWLELGVPVLAFLWLNLVLTRMGQRLLRPGNDRRSARDAARRGRD